MADKVEEPQNMAQVRAEVDRLDREIVARLARRFQMMDAAARIKPQRDHVRDEERKAQVLDNVRSLARGHGAPDERIADLYDRLIESSIAYEFERFDKRRQS